MTIPGLAEKVPLVLTTAGNISVLNISLGVFRLKEYNFRRLVQLQNLNTYSLRSHKCI
jgi:hypothetical protein